MTTLIGIRMDGFGGPVTAAAARAPTAAARTASAASITVQGRHRSLARPPTASSTVREIPYAASTLPSSSAPPCADSTYHGTATA